MDCIKLLVFYTLYFKKFFNITSTVIRLLRENKYGVMSTLHSYYESIVCEYFLKRES